MMCLVHCIIFGYVATMLFRGCSTVRLGDIDLSPFELGSANDF